MGLLTIILFFITSIIFSKTKFNELIIKFLTRLWMTSFYIGELWYYSLRKVLIVKEEGIVIQHPFRKSRVISWHEITSVEHHTYGMSVWTLNYNKNNSISISIDWLDKIKYVAKYKGIKIIE